MRTAINTFTLPFNIFAQGEDFLRMRDHAVSARRNFWTLQVREGYGGTAPAPWHGVSRPSRKTIERGCIQLWMRPFDEMRSVFNADP